jgi:hypothetical protein
MRAQELRDVLSRAREDPVAMRYAVLRDLLAELHKKVSEYATIVSLNFYFILLKLRLHKKSIPGEEAKTTKQELETLVVQFQKQLTKFPNPARIFLFFIFFCKVL